MWCDTYDHHAWFDYVTEVEDAYTLGEVVKNDGSVLSASTYPWICVMTLDANKYLDAYNSECREYGTHYLKDGQAATETATWYWNAALSKWQFRSSDAPIYINITHDKPVTEETYVLHYDANGGEIDRYSVSREAGISVRISYRGNLGYAYTERLDEPEKLAVEADNVTADRVRQLVYFPAKEEKQPLLLNLLEESKTERSISPSLPGLVVSAKPEKYASRLTRQGTGASSKVR